jgi:5'-nucleotidase
MTEIKEQRVERMPEMEKGIIRTYTGKMIDVFNPDPELIVIDDIAHALSNQCRFGGHTMQFYSVAEHCIHCSKMAPFPYTFEALMHDASEAYLVDVPRPVKIALPEYYKAEYRLMEVIAEKFGFAYPLSPEVQNIDDVTMQLEWENIVVAHNWIPMPQNYAKDIFLKQFHNLKP